MLYRVSQQTLFRSINTNLSLLSYDMARINNQIATGKRVNKPSDDPTGGAMILAMRTVLADITQYNRDVNVADSWLSMSEDVIQNMDTIVTRANELAEQMSTDTYQPENLDVAADEVSQLIQGLIQLGNSKISDRYIFSGQRTEIQPFSSVLEILAPEVDPNNSSSYTGDVKAPLDATYSSRPDLPAVSKNYVTEIVNSGGTGAKTQAYLTSNFGGVDRLFFQATGDYAGSIGNMIEIEYDETYFPGAGDPPARATVVNMSPPEETLRIRIDYQAGVSTTQDVVDAVNNDLRDPTGYPVSVGDIVTVGQVNAGVLVAGAPVTTSLTNGMSSAASTARVVSDPMGENNAILFEAKQAGAWGNDVRIDYVKAIPPAANFIDTSAGPPRVITVNLNTDSDGNVVNTADEVIAAINADSVARNWVTASLPPQGAGSGVIELSGSVPVTQSWQLTGGYDSSAMLTLGESGLDNGLRFVANSPDYAGTAGNLISVNLIDPGALTGATTATTTALGGGRYQIDVVLAHDGTNVTAVATDVIAAIGADVSGPPSASDLVTVIVNPGDTGAGVVTPTPGAISLSGGSLSDGAMFRVSEDGGLTWSEKLFDAAETLDPETIYNDKLGHAYLTTNFAGAANDIQIVAEEFGTSGNQIALRFVQETGTNVGTTCSLDNLPDEPFTITVHLGTDNSGNANATAEDVVEAINNSGDASIDRMVHASLKSYREGGSGVIPAMEKTFLADADPLVTRLGHATFSTDFAMEEGEKNPNVIFTAVPHGDLGPGQDIKVEYVVGTTTGTTVDPPQHVTTPEDYYLVTINLQTDADGNIIATAQDVVNAVNEYHYNNPDSLITANLPAYPDGGGVVQEMSAQKLTGGDDDVEISNYGAKIRFEGDGTALITGDRFNIDVGYYHGDDKDLEVNSNVGTKVKINLTGEEVLGANGAVDNILDTLSRLQFALEQHDSVMVAQQLQPVRDALEKLTTQMGQVGVRLVRNQFTLNILEATKVHATDELSAIEDLDIADAVTELQTKQTAYQAVLASTSLITKLSLVDYIR